MTHEKLHQTLREKILTLRGVSVKRHAGIHEDAFFVGNIMFMHIHGYGYCDIRLPKDVQQQVLAEGKARRHRYAPEAGYVTFVVHNENDLEPAMELVTASYAHFSAKSRGADDKPLLPAEKAAR
jgi:hypothetical protein